MSKKRSIIYLDHAASTPMAEEVRIAMEPYFKDKYFNPSAIYSESLKLKKELEQARSRVAKILSVKTNEIVFTSGGTESNNLAIHGIMRQYPSANLIYSAIEHDSIIAPAQNYKHKSCPVLANGRIDLINLEKLIDDQTVLVSIMMANNEIGTIESLPEIAQIIKKKLDLRTKNGIKLPLYLHSDGCQSTNYLSLQVAKLGIDLLTINGGKIYGPKQSGALFVRSGVKLSPLIEGGGQERGLRSGTENVPGIIGFTKALEIAQNIRKEESYRLETLRDYFIDQILKIRPDITLNGSANYRLANNIHLTIPEIDNEWLIMKLDEFGILIAAGSACHASSNEPSHVLKAIGLTDQQSQNSIRITLGRSSTKNELDQTIQIFKQTI